MRARMTGRRVPYLVLRGGVYQLRLPVPKHLHASLQRKEIQRSIHTRDFEFARKLAIRAGSNFADLCDSVEAMADVVEIDVPELIERFFRSLLASFEPPDPVAPADRAWDMNQQEYIAESMQADLARMVEDREYSASIKKDADALLDAEGLTADKLSKTQRAQLLEGVARARREQINYVMLRQRSLLEPYIASDPIFAKSYVQLAVASNNKQHGKAASGHSNGGSGGALCDRIEQYLDNADCKPNTIKEKRVVLFQFAQMVGPGTDVRLIAPEHMLEFLQALTKQKVQTPSAKKSQNAATKGASKTIHPKTAKKKLDTVKTFLNWLEAVDAISSAPGTKLQIKVPKTPKSQKRRPFTADELGVLFSSPMYTGCHSASLRHKPGKLIIKDDHYWMPLVLLYSGMRLAEPLQILASDVHVDVAYPYFDVDLAKLDLKQDVSDRFVPIHPDLIEFGFADFVRKRQKEKVNPRLFRGIHSKGHVANYYSKALGRYINRSGLDDPRLVAHSFRHGFKDALRNAAVPEGEQKFIMGHSDGEAAHNYGSGSKIEVLWNWVAKIDLQLPADSQARLQSN